MILRDLFASVITGNTINTTSNATDLVRSVVTEGITQTPWYTTGVTYGISGWTVPSTDSGAILYQFQTNTGVTMVNISDYPGLPTGDTVLSTYLSAVTWTAGNSYDIYDISGYTCAWDYEVSGQTASLTNFWVMTGDTLYTLPQNSESGDTMLQTFLPFGLDQHLDIPTGTTVSSTPTNVTVYSWLPSNSVITTGNTIYEIYTYSSGITNSLSGNNSLNVNVGGLAGTNVFYVSATSGGATNVKLTFTNGVLVSKI